MRASTYSLYFNEEEKDNMSPFLENASLQKVVSNIEWGTSPWGRQIYACRRVLGPIATFNETMGSNADRLYALIVGNGGVGTGYYPYSKDLPTFLNEPMRKEFKKFQYTVVGIVMYKPVPENPDVMYVDYIESGIKMKGVATVMLRYLQRDLGVKYLFPNTIVNGSASFWRKWIKKTHSVETLQQYNALLENLGLPRRIPSDNFDRVFDANIPDIPCEGGYLKHVWATTRSGIPFSR